MVARVLLYGAAVIIAAAWLSGCRAPAPSSRPPPAPGIAKPVGEWKLTQLPGTDLAASAVPLPTLSIASSGQVSGFSGVNRYTSTLDMAAASHGEFRLSPTASTRMAGIPEAQKLEDHYLAALQSATGFKADATTLTLTRGTQTVLGFARAE
jgi:heat shock protein HslJ